MSESSPDALSSGQTSAGASGAAGVDIRLNKDGSLDEVVSAFVHLEQMSATHWWLAAYDAKGDRVTVHLHSKATIRASVTREGAAGGTERASV